MEVWLGNEETRNWELGIGNWVVMVVMVVLVVLRDWLPYMSVMVAQIL